MKLWSGRFDKNTDALTDELNASIGFDFRMYKQDIAGSLAHSAMLAKKGIISQKDADDIAADWTQQALIRDNVFHNDARNLLPSITAGNPEWQMPPLTLINNRWENSGYAVDLSAAGVKGRLQAKS